MAQSRTLLISAQLFLAVFLAMPAAGQAQRAEILAEGRDDYAWHCAFCHGDAGRGDGPMAEMLAVPPIDLTRIAESTSGVFAFWRVYDVIAGETPIKGHESFQMPQFWERFRDDESKPGYLPAAVRILLLTHYLESLQAR